MKQTTRYLTDVIEEIDKLPCSHPASVNIDVAFFYYSLTKMVRPLLVVEIGCFIGFSTLHFVQALKEQGFGRMISIDAFDWEVDAGNGMENREIVARRYWERSGVLDTLTPIKGYSTEVYKDIEQDIKKSIDLLYIDGDHSINGVFADFNTYYNDVRVGGYIILHDIYPSMCGEFGPRTLIDHLKNKRLIPGKIELIELCTRDGFGVSVLRKVAPNTITVDPTLKAISSSILQRVIRKLKGKYSAFRDIKLPGHEIRCQIKILDAETRQPISGASLICPQRWNEPRVTDDNGVVVLEHYLPNRYIWHVTANGYRSNSRILIDITAENLAQHFEIYLMKI